MRAMLLSFGELIRKRGIKRLKQMLSSVKLEIDIDASRRRPRTREKD
jgi:hypothetical protein